MTQKIITIQSHSKRHLADMITPVGLYLKMRDTFNGGLLLESSDYQTKENSYSFLCFDPIVGFKIENDQLTFSEKEFKKVQNISDVKGKAVDKIQAFIENIEIKGDDISIRYGGFFGYTTFDAIPYFENISFDEDKKSLQIPEMQYSLFRVVIVINHFNNELFVILNHTDDQKPDFSEIDVLLNKIDNPAFSFNALGNETSSTDENEFKELVKKAKYHCQRGDVFQLVLSKRFSQQFNGDDFNVYRALRSINPSPYLFYFDYGGFRIFGSSPEAQLIINDGKAQIHPIAGTYRRTGDDETDRLAAIELSKDPKENSEHVMLVDLARNDLSRNTKKVHVETYKEIQYFSHVIHLVSKVEGELDAGSKSMRIYADTFPAGTLSGAPKYKALELIDKYEKENRSFYGGAIGFLKLNGELNHAILIRSFLSMNNTLYYQAGAGIVIDSSEEKELQEVKNKSEALRKAIIMANEI
ncbi:MAG: anthranilate synthase component I [Marinilabiliales bacterium]|nr:MAG: anthranilate synthase component I [Marinilabiliales bacterium]